MSKAKSEKQIVDEMTIEAAIERTVHYGSKMSLDNQIGLLLTVREQGKKIARLEALIEALIQSKPRT